MSTFVTDVSWMEHTAKWWSQDLYVDSLSFKHDTKARLNAGQEMRFQHACSIRRVELDEGCEDRGHVEQKIGGAGIGQGMEPMFSSSTRGKEGVGEPLQSVGGGESLGSFWVTWPHILLVEISC